VREFGTLFTAKLDEGSQARLLYHHLNATSYPMVVAAEVQNAGSMPARILVIPGDAAPSRNPVLAGLVAGEKFLNAWIKRSGEVVEIPPNSSMPLSLRKLAPGETSSGLCSLRLLSGGPKSLTVKLDARPNFATEAGWEGALASDTPWRFMGTPTLKTEANGNGAHSVHAYPDPYKDEEIAYEVGGRFGFARIGQRPISSASGEQSLSGNFGVVYTLKISMANPTAAPGDVEVVFEASAGYSAALFVVDGRVVRTPFLKAKEELQLTRIRLEPGQSRSLTLTTMPLSGSSYPATLTVRPPGLR
jgi:hypothetical protein